MKRSTSYVLLRAAVVAIFAVLIGRLWYMQIVQVNAYRAQATVSRLQYRIIQAPRGIFYDRHGTPLVRNVASYDVTITPQNWPTSPARAFSEARLLSSLLHHHPGPLRIQHLVTASPGPPTAPVTVRAGVDLATYRVIQAEDLHLPGVGATQTFTRHYLQSYPWPLSHLLGYVGPIDAATYHQDTTGPWRYQRFTLTDIVGRSELEAVYDHRLHGVNGLQSSEIDAAGDQISPWKTVSPVRPGYGVRLTIGAHFQAQMARDLQAGLAHIGLRQGAAVALNPNNGQVLGMVSLPSYNADLFGESSTPQRTRAIDRIYKDPLHPLVDLTISAGMPPGSIFKVVTATAGLSEGVVTPDTVVNDTGQIQPCPVCPVFHGWKALGPVDMETAIEQSSDIYFYELAGGGPQIPGGGLGPRRLDKWAWLYGLGHTTGIELPGENPGLVPTPHLIQATQHRPWSVGDSYNSGIGQGDNIDTPLQMARVVSTIANGGSLVRPHIVAAITYPNGRRALPGQNFDLVPDIARPHFVQPWVASLIAQGMRLGVDNLYGTSFGEMDPRLHAAGKTGTAEDGNGVVAWWMGFAPYNHPRIAIAVAVPNAAAEGAYVAAPIAGKIMEDYFHLKEPATWVDLVQQKFVGFGQ
ncbi:MAG TPA: penicillin-binding transpeptidase domain-containing protein [Chloroflexota bacterium]|nr:penicillin-binding transpeptidase domain-containing protein [Chloroflexota bacterium]